MEDTTVSIIGIVVAAILMLFVPLMLIANTSDDVSQLVVKTATANFVDEVRKTGKITNDKYRKFVEELSSSGNTYEIDIELKILDKNTAKYYTTGTQTGSNTYYSLFTSQIEDMLEKSASSGTENNSDGKIILKQGDSISVTVKNSSKTLSQSLKSLYYNVKGSDVQIIAATASGTIAVSGSR